MRCSSGAEILETSPLRGRRTSKILIRPSLRCSALPHGVGMGSDADADSGVLEVRAQIRHAFGAPCGCFAAKLRSDPQNQAARPFLNVFSASSPRKTCANSYENSSIPQPHLTRIRSRIHSPNPCECAEERKPRRIRARDCLSAASASGTPAGLSTGRCPQRSGGTQTPGSPFFCLLFFGEAKKSESPAAATERHRIQQRTRPIEKNKAVFPPLLRSNRENPHPLLRLAARPHCRPVRLCVAGADRHRRESRLVRAGFGAGRRCRTRHH